MKTNDYVGKSFYNNSILIRCACGSHFMEIYKFQDLQNNITYGIDWYSFYNYKKYKFPNFEFLCDGDFEFFCNTIAAFSNDLSPFDAPNCFYTMVHLKNGKSKRNGRLEINSDEFGYLNFIRYDKYEKGKVIWNLSIEKDELIKLNEKLKLFN